MDEVALREAIAANCKVKVRAGMRAVKIHGPNSKIAEQGATEEIGFPDGNAERVVVLDFDGLAEMIGPDEALQVFSSHGDQGRLIKEDHGN